MDLNLSIFNLFFSHSYLNNAIDYFSNKILKFLNIKEDEQNQKYVLEKLGMIITYLNTMFLKDLKIQMEFKKIIN